MVIFAAIPLCSIQQRNVVVGIIIIIINIIDVFVNLYVCENAHKGMNISKWRLVKLCSVYFCSIIDRTFNIDLERQ